MKIWRDDITKENLKMGSATTASFSSLLLIFAILIMNMPKVAVAVCIILALILCIVSVILTIKSKNMDN